MGFLGDVSFGLLGDTSAEEAAGDAARAAKRAGKKAIAELREQFDLTREDLLPYMEAGKEALADYQANIRGDPQAPDLADFSFDPKQIVDSPAYQFLMEQGMTALDRAAAGRGQLASGNRLYDVTRYAQGLASQEYGKEWQRRMQEAQFKREKQIGEFGMQKQNFADYMNRLGGLTETGLRTSGQVGAMRMGMAGDIGDIYQNVAAAQSAAGLMAGQQRTQGISDLWAAALGAL